MDDLARLRQRAHDQVRALRLDSARREILEACLAADDTAALYGELTMLEARGVSAAVARAAVLELYMAEAGVEPPLR